MFIVAEIGINHNGSIPLAMEMIRQAKIAGADIVKFQAYSVDKLFGPHGEDPREDLYHAVKKTELTFNELKILQAFCKEEEIGFMCSVFDEERLAWLELLHVKYHKIASRTSKLNPDLAKKIIATNKPCYMSLGFDAKPLTHTPHNVHYLYCVAEYPTPYKNLHIPEKMGLNSPFFGFSDHSLGIEASLIAAARGAQCIEKHFTLNKAAEGPDHVASIDPQELKLLVQIAKRINHILL
jgi:sialic acid synthase SpsE